MDGGSVFLEDTLPSPKRLCGSLWLPFLFAAMLGSADLSTAPKKLAPPGIAALETERYRPRFHRVPR